MISIIKVVLTSNEDTYTFFVQMLSLFLFVHFYQMIQSPLFSEKNFENCFEETNANVVKDFIHLKKHVQVTL